MQAQLVLGLGFGDEGKGTIVDWLARRSATPPLVVRWNGGPQAAHHVVAEGRVHCFAQLGSASFVPGARTHLGADMAVDPYALLAEVAALDRGGVPDALARLTIDPRAPLVTPWHAIVNRVRETLRGRGRHGSTGRGVFEAKLGPVRIVAAALGGDLASELADARDRLVAIARGLVEADDTARGVAERHDAATVLRCDAPARDAGVRAAAMAREEARELCARAEDRELFEAYRAAAAVIAPAAITMKPVLPETVIFEGAQGALLDRDLGFFPYVTPSSCTRTAALAAARELGIRDLETWGVLRAYHTRHGAGPFPSESSALRELLPEPHNPPGVAGTFRVGWFDAVLARYALSFAGPIDRLAVTSLDRVGPLERIVDGWSLSSEDDPITDLTGIPNAERTRTAMAARATTRPVDGDYLAVLDDVLGRRVEVASYGMSAGDKRPR